MNATEVNGMSVEKSEPAVMLSFPAAAGLMSVSKTVLYELVRCGRIRVVRIGVRGRRVPRTEIDRFARENLEGG